MVVMLIMIAASVTCGYIPRVNMQNVWQKGQGFEVSMPSPLSALQRVPSQLTCSCNSLPTAATATLKLLWPH